MIYALQERRRRTLSSPDQLSPENETLERRNLKSILKKLSAGSRAGSSETSATSTPDREAATAELRKLMRAPTLEGYAARHSKLSKSVTFNKYTLQSPPGNEPAQPTLTPLVTAQLPSSSSSSSQQQQQLQLPPSLDQEASANDAMEQQQQPLPLPPANKLSFRPLGSAGAVVASQLFSSRPREDEYMGELVSGIRDVIQTRLVSCSIHYNIPHTLSRHFHCTHLYLVSLITTLYANSI